MLLFIPPSGHTELADDPKLNSESIDVIVDGDGNGNGAFIHYHFCLVEVDMYEQMHFDAKRFQAKKWFEMFQNVHFSSRSTRTRAYKDIFRVL